ncbi:hypothetical protein AtubIFM55763_010327 [Aspergillus tubingensis]|uniref:aldo/keto reductase family protein n=1 Tax=Aspergillus tubingensis TaxID=5068 RepID=UPI001578F20F|nr:aldo/keto reductase family protein [Aspergillus tubingensis]GFN16493.1 aldo/keto reductase family protein [Aspergillus tubingensis]GLA61803.1 hypothetical protein AtubIFM54640_002334 [Aspergillus tubingensis]GLA69808.1 hypothetical protein AtubIFM55763_010327 [Aspergillus tubingensis]GLA92584.1 hypothetical protein AtubIFM57143_008937 [Aspergillus tubingensis]GLB16035.1 hypothetical protein AtubIFM61612_005870 [Aspergillus tubingensis]
MALSIGNANLSLTEHLSAPPKASLQILGTHNVNEDNNIIDFDIWVDCSKTVGIRSAKFLTENDVESRCWSYSADCDNGDPRDILGGWLDDWLNYDDADDQSWTLHKSGHFLNGDCTALRTHIERLAQKTAYGGSVEVSFHTPSIQSEARNNASAENGHIAQVFLEWAFECPFTPTDKVWSELVMNAMVDHKKGWIEPDVPRPSHGMSPLRRAMRDNGTSRVVSRDQNANGVTHSIRQFSSWGGDSSA